jgi:thioredoxin reductase
MTYDVIVIGGGPAGLSGAVALGRSLRSVLLVDSGEPRNAPADGIHNYLTRDGMTPAEFAAAGRAEVRKYGGTVLDGRVASATGSGSAFEVVLDDGSVQRARRLLVTAGLRDELPPIPGLAERWGHTVLHCPYCHGYEMRGRAIGIIAVSAMAMHQALLWRQLTPDVTVFQHTAPAFDEDQARQLAALGITVVPGLVESVRDDGAVVDGELVARDAFVVQTRIQTRGGFAGLTVAEHSMGVGTYIPAEDPTGRTSVPGVWVAGNVAEPMAQVVSSAAAGMMAGAAINMDLVIEDTAAAVAAYGSVASSDSVASSR